METIKTHLKRFAHPIRSWLIVQLTIASPLFAFGSVSANDASYSQTWIDIRTGSGFELRRTYNSRSIHNGLFGFGWCSEIESTLTYTHDRRIRLKTCHSPELIFSPVIAGRGLARAKDTIPPRPDDGTQFESARGASDRIHYQNGIYTRITAGGLQQQFDLRGRLLSYSDRGHPPVALHYDPEGWLREIRQGGDHFKVQTNPLWGRVTRVHGALSLEVRYEYEGENLIRARNSWKNEYRFHYDHLHNLTRIDYPDRTFESLTYDPDLDRVLQSRERDGCIESYKYLIHPSNPLHHTTDITRRCKKRITTHSRFEFKNERHTDGTTWLKELRIIRNGKLTEIEFHPTLGKALRFKHDSREVRSNYDGSGRLTRLHEIGQPPIDLQYTGAGDRPSVVERSDIGRLFIGYEIDGRIRTVHSPEGPTATSRLSQILIDLTKWTTLDTNAH